MRNADDDVMALAAGSRIIAWLDRLRQLCMVALSGSSIARSGRALAQDWLGLSRSTRRRQAGVIAFAAVVTHIALLSTSSGFHAWVVYIVPVIAGLIATLAILTGTAPDADKNLG